MHLKKRNFKVNTSVERCFPLSTSKDYLKKAGVRRANLLKLEVKEQHRMGPLVSLFIDVMPNKYFHLGKMAYGIKTKDMLFHGNLINPCLKLF